LALLSKKFNSKITINSVITKDNLDEAINELLPFFVCNFNIRKFKFIPMIKSFAPEEHKRKLIAPSKIKRKVIKDLPKSISKKNIVLTETFEKTEQMYLIKISSNETVPSENIEIKIPIQIYDKKEKNYLKRYGWYIMNTKGEIFQPDLYKLQG